MLITGFNNSYFTDEKPSKQKSKELLGSRAFISGRVTTRTQLFRFIE